MAYHFYEKQLRVLRKFIRQERNRTYLANTRFIIYEHILPTTEEFILHLKDVGAEIFSLLSKPYSIDRHVYHRLISNEIPILEKNYDVIEQTDFLDELLKQAISKSQDDNKKIVIVDVGGYFAKSLQHISLEYLQHIAGVVEVTTFGHNRYTASADRISTRIFSVARSELKEIEARFVGRDAVSAIDFVLRNLGITVSGRNALVLGYGMIGKNVARSLRFRDLNVYVYDKEDHRNLRAFIDGFHVHKKRELLKTADIIFSATAQQALLFDEIEECKNNVVLASVGSKDTEFDIKSIKDQALKEERLSNYIVDYLLPNSKHVFVVKDGTAVNFILESTPIEILDLTFSEILICVMMLLKKPEIYPPGRVHALDGVYLNSISKNWLRFVNVQGYSARV